MLKLGRRGKRPAAARSSRPVPLLSTPQALQHSWRQMQRARGAEWVAVPLIMWTVWRTYRRERRLQEGRTMAAQRAAIVQALAADLRGRRGKRFPFFGKP